MGENKKKMNLIVGHLIAIDGGHVGVVLLDGHILLQSTYPVSIWAKDMQCLMFNFKLM